MPSYQIAARSQIQACSFSPLAGLKVRGLDHHCAAVSMEYTPSLSPQDLHYCVLALLSSQAMAGIATGPCDPLLPNPVHVPLRESLIEDLRRTL
jgi:hypothetical protein